MAGVTDPATVLVTGATGYIATHLIKSLLDEGVYKVRGTVRSLEATEKIKPLKDLEPETAKYPLELVEATLAVKECWVEAVRGCTYVYHIASPFPGSGSDLTPEQQQERIIKPAVEGTLTVLQACADVGGVKRVVVTSSMAAISCGLRGDPKKPKDYVYTEEDWSDEAECTPYEVSKKKAEEAAWEFVNKLEDDKKFELAVVNPCFVQGPLLSVASGSVSQTICTNLLSGKVPAIPDINLLLVDVRDVVAVHRAAMETPEAAGNRYLAAAESVSFKEWASIIKQEFQDQGYSIPMMPMPKFGLWFLKFFDQTAKEMYSMWGLRIHFNTNKIESLGVKPRPVKETIIDMCYNLIELGIVPKKPRYKGVPKAPGGAEGETESSNKVIESPVDKPDTPADDKPAEAKPVDPAESEDKSAVSSNVQDQSVEDSTKSADNKGAEPSEESMNKPLESADEKTDKPSEQALEKTPETADDKPAESFQVQEQSVENPASSVEDKPAESSETQQQLGTADDSSEAQEQTEEPAKSD